LNHVRSSFSHRPGTLIVSQDMDVSDIPNLAPNQCQVAQAQLDNQPGREG